MPTGKMLTAIEVAERLGKTKMTVTRWAREGRLPGSFQEDPGIPNSPWMIPEETVITYEEQRLLARERQMRRVAVSAT